MSKVEYTDYTLKELRQYEKEGTDLPEEEQYTYIDGKAIYRVWGVSRKGKTYYIPYSRLKLSHIINIIKWIKQHPLSYSTYTLAAMEELLVTRLAETTENGKLLYAKV